MRIILFSRPQITRTAEEIRQLFDALHEFDFDYLLNEEFARTAARTAGIDIRADRTYGKLTGKQPAGTIMLCYGGDGTLLEGVHRLGGEPIPVMGINAGHLGFLTTAPTTGLKELFSEIARGRITTEPRTMLEVTGDLPGGVKYLRALNEFAVQRQGAGMLSVETLVDGQPVATYHGDGVIVATPTGSTAYALSAGGPIVTPSCACMVLAPLAPHNLTMRPVVIPDSSVITLRVQAKRSGAFITHDYRSFPLEADASFTVRRAEQPIFLAVPHNISFYDTLRHKMMWGVDLRG